MDDMTKTRKPPLPPIDDRISFLMHRIDAQLAVICNPHFRHLDVVLHNSRMLVILLEAGQARVADLVSRMVLPQSTISHQLRELERRELISRKTAAHDSRSTIVQLTAKGRRVAEQCNALSTEVYAAMVEGLSAADIERLRAQLRSMFSRLEKLRVDKLSERALPRGKPLGAS
jgi:DNA-binding MarR family transcriptional regulator